MSGFQTRSPHRRVPVWGFPKGYDPNLMGDACELCHRSDNWEGRPTKHPDLFAWTCRCTSQPMQIPDC